jgi:hypothetical protein
MEIILTKIISHKKGSANKDTLVIKAIFEEILGYQTNDNDVSIIKESNSIFP